MLAITCSMKNKKGSQMGHIKKIYLKKSSQIGHSKKIFKKIERNDTVNCVLSRRIETVMISYSMLWYVMVCYCMLWYVPIIVPQCLRV